VALGSGTLTSNTTGNFNMAIGAEALRDNNANFNVAVGFRVGFMNTTGNHLTGIGAGALRNNTTGGFNTAIGADALRENTTAGDNTAIGADALSKNTRGEANTAIGELALFRNIDGNTNTAIGYTALLNNVSGDNNTAVGETALYSDITGSQNTAIGDRALFAATGNNNTALGSVAGGAVTTASNVICIGHSGANVSNSCFIGNVAGVDQGAPSAAVFINTTTGQLGTTPPSSSRRFKHDIKPMEKTSEAILALKPVTFRYKSDNAHTPQFGLVAEEVAEVDADLVVRDEEGEIYTVRYDAVNAMLLNEFLKEHRTVAKQETTISQLRSEMAQQQKDFQSTVAQLSARLDEQAAQIQKVSAQFAAASPSGGGLEVNRQAPQMISSNQ
jgi:Chaperone of endosialidase